MDETLAPWMRAKAKVWMLSTKKKDISLLCTPTKRKQASWCILSKPPGYCCYIGREFRRLVLVADCQGPWEDRRFLYFLKRSSTTVTVFNKETAFFHIPKIIKEEPSCPSIMYFPEDKVPTHIMAKTMPGYINWDVQHNVGDLVIFMGGKDSFATNLDQMFNEPLGKQVRILPCIARSYRKCDPIFHGKRTQSSYSLPVQLCRSALENPEAYPQTATGMVP